MSVSSKPVWSTELIPGQPGLLQRETLSCKTKTKEREKKERKEGREEGRKKNRKKKERKL